MRIFIIGLLLISLFLTAGYTAIPQLARYFLVDWLEQQGFNNVTLDIDHPSEQALFIKTIQLSQQQVGRRVQLSASDIRVSYQAHQLLSQQRLQQILLPRIELTIEIDESSNTNSTATDIALDQLLPADLIQLLPAERLLVGEFDINYRAPSRPNISAKASLDLTNQELISRLQVSYNQQPLGWTDLYFNDQSGFQLSQQLAEQELFKFEGQIQPQSQHLNLSLEQQIELAPTLNWLALIFPISPELTKINGRLNGQGEWQLPLRLTDNWLEQLNGHQQSQMLLDISKPLENIQHTKLNGRVDLDISQSILSLTFLPETKLDLSVQALGKLPALHLSTELDQPLQLTSPLHAPMQIQSSALNATLTTPAIQLDQTSIKAGSVQLALQPVNLQYPVINASLNTAQLQIKHPTYPQAQFSVNNKISYDPNLPLQLESNWHLQDSAVSLNNRAKIHLATQQVTFNWQLETLPLTGIETLVRKYFTAIPPELSIESGQLSHHGQGSWRNNTLQLAAETSLEALNVRQDKLNAQQISWRSNSQFDGKTLNSRGQLEVPLINVGVPIEQLSTQYQLTAKPETADWSLKTSAITANILGGQVSSDALDIFSDQSAYNAKIYAEDIELESLLELEQQPGLTGSGKLSGELPLHWQDNALTISGGSFANVPPGGVIRFQPEQGISALTQANPHLKIALDALDNFHYHSLQVDVDYLADGTTFLATTLKGSNPDWNNGHPVNLSLNLEENLIQLLRTLQFTDKLTKSIEKRYGNDK